MADVSKETEESINQLQLLEQSLQSFLVQKQQFQTQLVEVESALKELETSKESYKIVGNIMVQANKEDLKKDLESKKEMLNIRIKTLEKQESQIKEKSTKLQSEVVDKIKEKK
jgi:prefoldin beta subunit